MHKSYNMASLKLDVKEERVFLMHIQLKFG